MEIHNENIVKNRKVLLRIETNEMLTGVCHGMKTNEIQGKGLKNNLFFVLFPFGCRLRPHPAMYSRWTVA